jgi:hypothetical protein
MLRTFFLAALILLLLSCERIPLKEYANPEYDGQLTWTEVTKRAEWPERYDHAALAYDQKLWIFGGYNPGQVKGDTYYEDIWSSVDGETWEMVSDTAPWLGRRGHRMVVFDDGSGEAMFLIGGYSVDEASGYRKYNNDIWKSSDGINWIEIKPSTEPELSDTTDWMPRMYHACLTVNHEGTDYIYIIGGMSQLTDHSARYACVYHNDVWRSSDAVNWEKLPSADYGVRSEHGAAVDLVTGRIYVQGGLHGIIVDTDDRSSHPLPDWHYLWYTDDGIEWHALRDSASVDDKYLYRSAHKLVNYGGKIWSFPGKTTSTAHYHFVREEHFTIWTYEEDGLWEIDSKGATMDPRHSYATAIFDNRIWIFGGFTDTNAQSNDVWTAQY